MPDQVERARALEPLELMRAGRQGGHDGDRRGGDDEPLPFDARGGLLAVDVDGALVAAGRGVDRSRFRTPDSRRTTSVIASPPSAVFAAP